MASSMQYFPSPFYDFVFKLFVVGLWTIIRRQDQDSLNYKDDNFLMM